MKIQIIAIGKLKKGAIFDLFSEYHKRTTRWKIELKEFPESRLQSSAQRKEEEGQKLLAASAENALIIALDERGDMHSSPQMASFMQSQENASLGHFTFIIGGPEGLSEAVRQKAAHIWALGKATWPHQIVRALLMEQIYRCQTIITDHPYHKN